MTDLQFDPKEISSTSESRAQLHRWLRKQTSRQENVILPSQEAGPLPLSFAQERIWFVQQMLPSSAGYHLPIAFRLKGNLEIALLRQSLQTVLQQHAILRTTIQVVDGTPAQIIHEQMPLSFTITDFTHLDRNTLDERLEQALLEEFQRPFDLAVGPLWRTTLFRRAEREYLLLIVIHHIISDGWSNGIFIQDLGKLYIAFRAGQPSPLAPLPLQYADVVRWERQQFQNGAMEEHRQYWQKKLAQAPSLLPLPLDHPRPAIQTFNGATCSFHLSETILRDLQKACNEERVTLTIALLSTLTILLFRYTAQTDILVGLPVFNRYQSETERIMGLFVNTLVLHTSLANSPSFRAVLQQVRQTALEAYQHQKYPFEKLVETLQPERSTSHSPLFQVMLAMRAGNETALTWSDLELTPYELSRPCANFDLTLDVFEQTEGLHLAFNYRTDLFDAETIERLARQFLYLLENCLLQPDRPVQYLSLLTPDERDQIIVHWNATRRDFSGPALLHQLIEQQAAQTPDSVAVVAEESFLTYDELNVRANQLAHYLLSMSIRPDVPVAICAERSLELVIGLLAILKAGGAYVPLDPSYPAERLAFLLSDCQAPVLLTQAHLTRLLPAHTARTILLNELDIFSSLPQHNPVTTATAKNLAYIIYTSGSTGNPKGTMNTHTGICNRLRWMQETYQLHAQDRVLQKTPYSFDVSVWEFFWPLFTNATLIMARPEGHRDSLYLCELIQREAITRLHFVPSMLRVFLDEPSVSACTSLRDVFCSGESLSVDLQQAFAQRLAARLHNLYGPTEAAVDVTYWECLPQVTGLTIPIGRPIANMQIYILDAALQPVPVGVPGELLIGGPGLARGYYHRPDLTAEKFIPHPFSDQPGERLYRTGDEARFCSDGLIEFLGRLDYQIKLRGFRIELEEIQATIEQYSGVEQAVVQVWEKTPGDKQLIAYLVPAQSVSQTVSTELIQEVQHFLRSRLPDYMVPASFILLSKFPLGPGGKVNRQQLPIPKQQEFQANKQFVPPQTDIERAIAGIWSEVLQLPQIGREDNFFELGGHSLLVPRVRTKLHEQLGIELSLLDLFRFPTVQALTEHLKRDQKPSSTMQGITNRAALQRQALRRKRRDRE